MRKTAVGVLLVGGLLVAVGGPVEALPGLAWQSTAATPAAGLAGIESEILAAATPVPVADEQLALGRVTVQPGAVIPPHEHPGTQLATILAGELTYTVLTGAVAVAGADGADITIRAGETLQLRPGDAVIEQPGALHTARNNGDEPVVIVLATLFPAGSPRTLFQEMATPTA